MSVLDIKNCIVRLEDGGSNYIALSVGEGTLNYTERRPIEYLMEKGKIDEVREGDEVPMDVSFQFRWKFIRSNTANTPSIEDALKNRYEAASWVSSDSDACRPYSVDIVIVNDPTCNTEMRERITLPYFRYEELQHDLKDARVSCSGKCNAKQATVDRGEQYS